MSGVHFFLFFFLFLFPFAKTKNGCWLLYEPPFSYSFFASWRVGRRFLGMELGAFYLFFKSACFFFPSPLVE